MDVGNALDTLKEIAPVISMGAVITLGIVGLLYKIKHDRNERCRKDMEKRDNIRNALKRIHEELKDALDAINADKGIHNYRDRRDGETILFLKTKFWHAECEDLIKSPEVRSTDIGISKIKDVVGIIKENNKIFDWMERSLPMVNKDESVPHVGNDAFPNMLEDCKKMHNYQEQMRKDIPPILKKIEKVCDRID